MPRNVSSARLQNRNYTNSLFFNGGTDYAQSSATIVGTSGFSIAFWLYTFPYYNLYGRIFDYFDFGSTNGHGVRCYFYNSTGGLAFDCANGTNIGGPQITGMPVVGQWQHVCITNVATTSTIYVNAIQVTSGYAPYSQPTGQTFTLARDSSGTNDYGTFCISELYIKDGYVFSLTDVQALMSSGKPSNSPGAFYKLNGNLLDTSGNNRTLTVSGTSYSTNVVSSARITSF